MILPSWSHGVFNEFNIFVHGSFVHHLTSNYTNWPFYLVCQFCELNLEACFNFILGSHTIFHLGSWGTWVKTYYNWTIVGKNDV